MSNHPHGKHAYRIVSYREAIAELPSNSAWAGDLDELCESMYGMSLADVQAKVADVDFSAIEDALEKGKALAERDCLDLGLRDWLASLDNWKIVILDGDAEFGAPLDLCQVETYFPERAAPDSHKDKWFVLVKGNLKAGNVFCSREYGACDLVVTGDLSVRNLAVGGDHEVCVGGSLDVGGLFYGNYASGSLKVGRSIRAQVFVRSSGYIISIGSDGHGGEELNPRSAQAHEGAHDIRHCLLDGDLLDERNRDSQYRRRAAEVIRPEFLRPAATVLAGDLPASSWTAWLDYPAIMRALAADAEVVQEAG